MNKYAQHHIQRLEATLLKRYSASQIARWLTDNTKIALDPFSFVNHEYQERILNDDGLEIVIRKCSQVGISEISARMALALVSIVQPYTVAYTLPTAGFAAKFATTRLDPIIEGSEALKDSAHKTNNNSEVKQFGHSFLWIRGAASSNAPISIPVDHLIHDEVDFCDQEVLTKYQSRLTHSSWKRKHNLSTPTLPNFGIDRKFQESVRHFMMVKCCHCNHYFVPDYYTHVRVPGFTKDLREVTKGMLGQIRYKEAFVECPKCGSRPDLNPEHREWVAENPDAGFIARGYQVSPFDAPNVIATSYLIEASVSYDRIQDFHNFNLGLPSEDKESTLTRADLISLFLLIPEKPPGAYVMGIDVGNIYHFVISHIDGYGRMTNVHREKVPMGLVRTRYTELRREYRVICTVIDSGPHAETVMGLQADDPNLFAAVYMRSKSMLTHNVVYKDENKDEGVEFVRQVNVNRNRAFDAYMNFIRDGLLTVSLGEDMEEYISHHTSMKRVRVFDNDSGEMTFSWQKTDGVDHFHHASLYCWIAGRIKGLGRPLVELPFGYFGSFKVNQRTTVR